jgi:outer membrane biogenesis lipoprotein LolB
LYAKKPAVWEVQTEITTKRYRIRLLSQSCEQLATAVIPENDSKSAAFQWEDSRTSYRTELKSPEAPTDYR